MASKDHIVCVTQFHSKQHKKFMVANVDFSNKIIDSIVDLYLIRPLRGYYIQL